jgi:glycosyltransferase involved in cell wall biosynthesis
MLVRPTFCDGDSISVREAISLGVPVVGSNVGTRPADTLLFEVGDIDGLVRQVENVLEWEENSPPPMRRGGTNGRDGFDQDNDFLERTAPPLRGTRP